MKNGRDCGETHPRPPPPNPVSILTLFRYGLSAKIAQNVCDVFEKVKWVWCTLASMVLVVLGVVLYRNRSGGKPLLLLLFIIVFSIIIIINAVTIITIVIITVVSVIIITDIICKNLETDCSKDKEQRFFFFFSLSLSSFLYHENFLDFSDFSNKIPNYRKTYFLQFSKLSERNWF